ncbi:XRE family transcriptional regulator [Corynebacterium diphtheriae]|uniref:XRE family transcriptional regulator n=1 Tax=Corynebacterium diphtheriae TaxID=1717 RepID=UPI0015F6E509|nr:XRE family transcriptional regulator [Corynebacterium diphtheriae]
MGTLTVPRFRVRPGVLDHIMRTRRLQSDEQLAAALGTSIDNLADLRAGAPITARMALHIAALQGDSDFVAGYCEPLAA